MKTKLTLIVALFALAILSFLLHRQINTSRQLDAQLATAHSELERLQDQSSAIANQQSVPRQNDAQQEAIKLRGEITNLKLALATAQSAAARAPKTPEPPKEESEPILKTDPLPENNPDVSVLTTKLRTARLPSGHVLTLGGWESQPGKRAYVFIQPTSDPNGASQVSVTAKWVELTAEAAEKFRFGDFLDTSGEQSSFFKPIAFDETIKKLEAASGVDLLSTPTITTSSGRQARLSVAETRDTPGGPVAFGPMLDIIPTIGPDGAIDITLQASLIQDKRITPTSNPPNTE
jgi:hypothetical protein